LISLIVGLVLKAGLGPYDIMIKEEHLSNHSELCQLAIDSKKVKINSLKNDESNDGLMGCMHHNCLFFLICYVLNVME